MQSISEIVNSVELGKKDRVELMNKINALVVQQRQDAALKQLKMMANVVGNRQKIGRYKD